MGKGPLLSDKLFFNSLSEDLKEIKEKANAGQYDKARALFAKYIRATLDISKFFTIPYEVPENIYKLPGESDSDACKRIEDYKVVSVGVLGDFSKERRIDWTANPTYNGYKEWTWQLSRHNEIKMMAHEYNRTKDEKIAQAALDIMRSWLESQIVPPIGTIGYATETWRTIECGIRMGANWPYILFSFIQSPFFTDDLIIEWFKSVYEHAIRLINDRTRANWLIMEMNGLAHIGILCPFFKDSRAWLEDAISTLSNELDKQFYPDGFQYELTTNYHDVVVNNYQRLFETANAFSVELPDSMKKKLENACTLFVRLMMPDGKLPDLNDGNRGIVKDLLLPKSRFFSSDEISFVLNGTKEPDYTSCQLSSSGFAIFRSGWTENDVWALLDAAPFGRAHQHEDKLNFIMYAVGKYLLCEGGIYAYDESEMRKYILSTRSHNTVRVDSADQDRRSSYTWNDEDIDKPSGMVSNIPNKDIEFAYGTYDEGYAGVDDKISHTRKVIFLRDSHVFIIIDDLKAGKTHDWKILWHVDDDLLQGLEFENLNVFIPTKGVSTSIVRGQTEPELQGFISLGQKQGDYKEVNCIIATAKAQEKSVVTVFQPKEKNIDRLKAVRIEDDAIVLTYDNHEKRFALHASQY